MKLPHVNPPETGKPAGSYLLFEFIPRCPEKRDLHYVPTPMNRDLRFASTGSGKFKFKYISKPQVIKLGGKSHANIN